MKSLSSLILLLALCPGAAWAAIGEAGYYGETLQLGRGSGGSCQLDTSRFDAQRNQGTSPTYATALGDGSDVYLLADCAGALAYFAQTHGTKLIIDLTGVLFDPALNYDLRPNYQAIMADFYSRAQASVATNPLYTQGFTSGNTVTAIIHNEAGNAAASRADVNYAAQEWDLYYPQIPTTAGYPISNGSSPLPPVFPWRLDYVATWDYDTFSPLNPASPNNRAIPTFYDPNAPTSTSTKWGDFLSRLQSHQKVFLLIAGWYGCWQLDNGWPRWYMKYVARGFCKFALQRPEIEHVTVWLWESYPSSPTQVQCQTGTVAYDFEGSAQLASTGILPFHDAIFDVAAGTGSSCN